MTSHGIANSQPRRGRAVPQETPHFSIVNSCQHAIYSSDLDGIITTWNPAAFEIFGYSAQEMVGQSIQRLIPDNCLEEEIGIRRRVRAEGRIKEYETIRIKKNGERIDVAVTISSLSGSSDRVAGSSQIERILSGKKRRDTELLTLAAIVEYSSDAIVGTDMEGIIVSWNEAASLCFGYTAEEIAGQPILSLIPDELHPQKSEMLTRLRQGKYIEHFQTTMLRKDGGRIKVSLAVSPVRAASGRIVGGFQVVRAIPAGTQPAAYLSDSSQHDQLTGLPNPTLLHDRLEMMLAQARRKQGDFAVVRLDLNHHLRYVGDMYGQSVSDQVLIQVAARFKAVLRSVDTVARMGNDDFVLLLPEVQNTDDVGLVVDKLKRQLITPVVVSGHTIDILSANIGVCMYHSHIGSPDSMLEMAEIAMHRAKTKKTSGIEFFSDEVALTVFRHEHIESTVG